MCRYGIAPFFKGDAPVQKQAEPGLRGMASGLHHNETALRNGAQLVRCHQGTLHHLQGAAGVVLALTHGTYLYGTAAEGLGQDFPG